MRGKSLQVLSKRSNGFSASAGDMGAAPISKSTNPLASNLNPSRAVRNVKSSRPCKCLKEHFFKFSLGWRTTVTLILILYK